MNGCVPNSECVYKGFVVLTNEPLFSSEACSGTKAKQNKSVFLGAYTVLFVFVTYLFCLV